MTDNNQHILNHLDKRLIELKDCYPVEYKIMLNRISAKRGGNTLDKNGVITDSPWSDELINAVDSRLRIYEETKNE